jgi:hypothetical protein
MKPGLVNLGEDPFQDLAEANALFVKLKLLMPRFRIR